MAHPNLDMVTHLSDGYFRAYSDDSSDDDQPPTFSSTSTTTKNLSLNQRPNQNLLHHHLHHHHINGAHIQKFLEGIEKEANSWAEWRSIQPLTAAEAARVRADPALRKRIWRSKAAYRDKRRGQGQLKAKCALGHNNPCIYDITPQCTDPRTCNKTHHVRDECCRFEG